MSTQQKLFLKSFFLTLLSLLTIIALTFLIFFENSPLKNSSSVNNTAQVPKLSPITILYSLRSEEKSVPDFFSLVTVNSNKATITTVTFPKNTAVYLNNNTSTLAQSYGHGGPETSKNSLNSTYAIPIDYYADLTYQEFGQLLSTLGKIEYKVFENIEAKGQDGKTTFKLQSGNQVLNGAQIAGLIQYSSLSYKEKGILLDDLIKTFVEQNAKSENTTELSNRLDKFFNRKNTDFTTAGTHKMEQLLTHFPFDQLKIVHPIITGVTQESFYYLDDSTLASLNQIYNQTE